jgi:hypothetical protein
MLNLKINGVTHGADNEGQLISKLRSTGLMPFREISLCNDEDESALTILMNGRRGIILYTRFEGDAGFTSRSSNPIDSRSNIAFVLSNGQQDYYPEDWVVSEDLIVEACLAFLRNHGRATSVIWHYDGQ